MIFSEWLPVCPSCPWLFPSDSNRPVSVCVCACFHPVWVRGKLMTTGGKENGMKMTTSNSEIYTDVTKAGSRQKTWRHSLKLILRYHVQEKHKHTLCQGSSLSLSECLCLMWWKSLRALLIYWAQNNQPKPTQKYRISDRNQKVMQPKRQCALSVWKCTFKFRI